MRCEKPDYLENVSSEAAFAEAERMGLKVVLPSERELFIDIDDKASYRTFLSRTRDLEPWFDFSFTTTPSRSGGDKKHVIVTFDDFKPSAKDRIFLQLYLGSDPTREFLSLQRILALDPHPTLFFERPE